MTSCQLKICGLRTPESLTWAAIQKIDFVGLNFVSSSRRYWPRQNIDQSWYEHWRQSFEGKVVGVFQNAPLDEIRLAAKRWQLDIVQLHGDEQPDFAKKIKNTTGKSIWKAVCAGSSFSALGWNDMADLVLLDGSTPGQGVAPNRQQQFKQAQGLAFKFGVGISGGVSADTWDQLASFLSLSDVVFDTASGVEVQGEFSMDRAQQLLKLIRTER